MRGWSVPSNLRNRRQRADLDRLSQRMATRGKDRSVKETQGRIETGAAADRASRIPAHSDMPETLPVAYPFDRYAAAAFLSYLALSILIFGRGVLASPKTVYIGQGPDPQTFIWYLTWWAYTISHRLNPFMTNVVWAPSGASLAWSTDFPLASCLLYPITQLWGPIVSCNVLHIIAPPLAGWSMFVLCRYLVWRFWPAWIGGFVFAFSSYMLTGMADGLLLMLVFPLPLAVWATLRRLANEITARGFLAITVLLLIIQFLLAIEIIATAAFFGAIALFLAARWSSTDEYRRLLSVACLVASAYVISALILSPYLYLMFSRERPHEFILSPWRTSMDAVGLFIPTILNELGNLSIFQTIAHQFLASLYDCGGYVGLPLVVIVALFARARWHDPASRLTVSMFVIACVLAMGPFLEILGWRILPLPGAALAGLPLIDKAQPGRLMLYAYLALAVIVAKWLAEEGGRKELRWMLGLAIVPFVLPSLRSSFWETPAEIPVFFSSNLYRQYLSPGETVMVLPYGHLGEGMLWQAATNLYFRMAGGYLSAVPPVPSEHIRWPIVAGLFNIAGVPEADDQLKAYLTSHGVSVVIVGPRTHYLVGRMGNQQIIDTWLRWPTVDQTRIATDKLLASLNTHPIETGGVTLYRIAPQTLVPYRNLTALEMQRRMARARFEALLLGAERYLVQGGDPASLSPQRAQKLGVFPRDWFGGGLFRDISPHPAYFHFKVVLGPSEDGRIAVGIEDSYEALEPLIELYGANAGQIYFPYPAKLSSASVPHEPAMMVFTFDRAGLERAAALATQRQATGLHPDAPAPAAVK